MSPKMKLRDTWIPRVRGRFGQEPRAATRPPAAPCQRDLLHGEREARGAARFRAASIAPVAHGLRGRAGRDSSADAVELGRSAAISMGLTCDYNPRQRAGSRMDQPFTARRVGWYVLRIYRATAARL